MDSEVGTRPSSVMRIWTGTPGSFGEPLSASGKKIELTRPTDVVDRMIARATMSRCENALLFCITPTLLQAMC